MVAWRRPQGDTAACTLTGKARDDNGYLVINLTTGVSRDWANPDRLLGARGGHRLRREGHRSGIAGPSFHVVQSCRSFSCRAAVDWLTSLAGALHAYAVLVVGVVGSLLLERLGSVRALGAPS
jgi:hypothetical protein